MLVITIYKTSNGSRWYPVAKSHQDRQVSRREQLRTLVMFSGGACVFSNQLPHVLWLMVVSQCFQTTGVANFSTSFSFYSCVTMDGNPAFTVHATAHVFRAAINFNSMLLRQHIWCLRIYLIFDGLTNFMLKWIWCDSEGNYDDWFLFGGCLNKSWLLLETSNCKWATAFSILVILVYFSVTLRDARRAGGLFPLFFGRQRGRS